MFQSAMIRYGISFLVSILILAGIGLIPNFQEPAPPARTPKTTRVNLIKAPTQSVAPPESTVVPPVKPQPIPETPLPEKKPVPASVQPTQPDNPPIEKPIFPSSSTDDSEPTEATVENTPAFIEYKNIVLGSIARRKIYPMSARRREQEGIVKIRIKIDGNGQLLSREIVKSSGFTLLDEATVRAVEKAAPFPRPQTDCVPIEITFGMDYKLE